MVLRNKKKYHPHLNCYAGGCLDLLEAKTTCSDESSNDEGEFTLFVVSAELPIETVDHLNLLLDELEGVLFLITAEGLDLTQIFVQYDSTIVLPL